MEILSQYNNSRKKDNLLPILTHCVGKNVSNYIKKNPQKMMYMREKEWVILVQII